MYVAKNLSRLMQHSDVAENRIHDVQVILKIINENSSRP